MRQKLFLVFLFFCTTVFSQYEGNTTPGYDELIRIFRELDRAHDEIELYTMGDSDYGKPVYLCIINGKQDSLRSFEAARRGTTVLINNAIHPGEPDGVNACLIWIQRWIEEGKSTDDLPLIAIVPAYNVGGMHNRSGTSRANQDGPEEYGFRGNANNLDLNRDCIKSDSKNMYTFARIFQALDPDVFLDTHVSNGADYQYTMTYIASMRERMAPQLGNLMYDQMIPHLEKVSAKRGFELCPYVYSKEETPESGLEVFNDLPRYIMGYASLFDALSFTLETHMLKPFPQRVQATLVFLDETIQWTKANSSSLESARSAARNWQMMQSYFRYNYTLSDKADSLLFKGYAFSNPTSPVTGLPRLKYHRDQPYEKYVPYFHSCFPKDSLAVPDFLVVGGQCTEVIERLRSNSVKMQVVKHDSLADLKQCRIVGSETGNRPYEGHFLHTKVRAEWLDRKVVLKPGDCLIPLDQPARRFILNVLIPDAPDSYLAWNFFDSYLQQKEHFSAYVFEDVAAGLLENNPDLRQAFELLRAENEQFRNSSWEQLYFIYQHSPFYEPTHNFLPVYMGWKR